MPAAAASTPARRERELPDDHRQPALDQLAGALARSAELFAFDTETTSLDYMQAEIVGVSFADRRRARRAYVPLAHDYPGAPEQLDREAVLDKLQTAAGR